MAAAAWFVNLLTAYAVLGVLFAAAFITVGVSHVDPVAKGAGAGFRLIVFPGVVVMWPLLLGRWIRKGRRTI